jgi:hypothetical protein
MARKPKLDWEFTPIEEALITALWHRREIPLEVIKQEVRNPPDFIIYRKAIAMGLGSRHKGRARFFSIRKPVAKADPRPFSDKRDYDLLTSILRRFRPSAEEEAKWDRFPVPGPTPEDLATPIEQRATLESLEPHRCRWPIGHPDDPDFFFCGAVAEGGTSYCFTHHRRARGGS